MSSSSRLAHAFGCGAFRLHILFAAFVIHSLGCTSIEGAPRVASETAVRPRDSDVLSQNIDAIHFAKTPFPEVLAKLSERGIVAESGEPMLFVLETVSTGSSESRRNIPTVTLRCGNIPLYVLLEALEQVTGTSFRHEDNRIIFSR